MSFVRTMATLAVGFAAAKGLDRFQRTGGGAGLADSVRSAATRAGLGNQVGVLLERMQVPGGADAFKENLKRMGSRVRAAGDAAAVGMGGIMAALGGASWAGSGNAKDLLWALGSGDAPDGTKERNARLLIRAMIQAAKCDGEIDPREKAAIMEVMGDMTDEERAFVEAEMARPLDVAGLAAETGIYQRTAVYAASVVPIVIDNPAEVAYLNDLARALSLGRGARQRIHKAMRLPQVLLPEDDAEAV